MYTLRCAFYTLPGLGPQPQPQPQQLGPPRDLRPANHATDYWLLARRKVAVVAWPNAKGRLVRLGSRPGASTRPQTTSQEAWLGNTPPDSHQTAFIFDGALPTSLPLYCNVLLVSEAILQ